MSRYAGIKSDGFRGYNGRQGDEHIIRQSLIADRVLKGWREKHKDELEKYNAHINELKYVADELDRYVQFKPQLTLSESIAIEQQFNKRADLAKERLAAMTEDYQQTMMKAGLTTAIGYNFIDLRGPAYMIYPVNVPFRNSLPRWGKVNAGYGTLAQWKFANNPGTAYAGAAEGKRVAVATPPETDAASKYAELGIERSVTFTAEFAGEGYTDNVSDEHIRGLHELFLQEESIILGGNRGTSGTGVNGFVLGTANTPSVVVAASIPTSAQSDGSTAGFTNNTSVSVRVIELTMLGNPNNAQYGYGIAPTVAAGLVPTATRSNADATSDVISGGMGAVSAASAIVTAITSTPFVKASVVPKAGAVAWAWFVDTTDSSTPSAANAFLAAITTVPVVYLGSKSSGIGSNQAANAAGLSTDNSTEALDFEGILSWTAAKGIWTNMSNIAATDPSTNSAYNGLLQITEAGTRSAPSITQIEFILQTQWQNFQTVADELWCSADAKKALTNAVLAGGNGNSGGYRFNIERDAMGNISGGVNVTQYLSIYSMKATGTDALPVRIHPMLPPGSILFHKNTNPYPHSRIPGVSGLFVQRDYYGIEWPIVTRQWPWGEYVHETYAHYIPGLLAFLTGIQGVSTT